MEPTPARNYLNTKERKKLASLLSGHTNPDSDSSQRFLNRPHVAIAFEAILDKYDLSDDALIKRLKEIVSRKATTSVSSRGTKSTNITQVDANAKEVIKLIWQVQGKFVEKHEVRGELSGLEDTELDSLIDGGVAFLRGKGKVQLNHDKPGDT